LCKRAISEGHVGQFEELLAVVDGLIVGDVQSDELLE
jgi:hypothetical protein